MTILEAYRRALNTQVQPAMLVLAIGPVLAAGLFWAVVMWWKWAALFAAIEFVLNKLPFVESVSDRLVLFGMKILPGILVLWILAALYVPLTLLCALGFVSIAGMPIMLRHVASREFPRLERRHGGGFFGSLANSAAAFARFALLALPTFPFWFVPLFGWLILPFLLGRLNARVLGYDALADHASAEELAALRVDPKLSWGWLGFTGALLNVIPFFWFFSSTLTGLAFIHYALDALARRRPAAPEVLPPESLSAPGAA
jgi:hypothetical protein